MFKGGFLFSSLFMMVLMSMAASPEGLVLGDAGNTSFFYDLFLIVCVLSYVPIDIAFCSGIFTVIPAVDFALQMTLFRCIAIYFIQMFCRRLFVSLGC